MLRQLIGNNDEVTDLRFICAEEGEPVQQAQQAVGSSGESGEEPTHLVVSTNSEHIRVFSLADMSCSASLAGHTAVVLGLDVVRVMVHACTSACHETRNRGLISFNTSRQHHLPVLPPSWPMHLCLYYSLDGQCTFSCTYTEKLQ
jgi:hypothetical protein